VEEKKDPPKAKVEEVKVFNQKPIQNFFEAPKEKVLFKDENQLGALLNR
jgi:hypothetical protein